MVHLPFKADAATVPDLPSSSTDVPHPVTAVEADAATVPDLPASSTDVPHPVTAVEADAATVLDLPASSTDVPHPVTAVEADAATVADLPDIAYIPELEPHILFQLANAVAEYCEDDEYPDSGLDSYFFLDGHEDEDLYLDQVEMLGKLQ